MTNAIETNKARKESRECQGTGEGWGKLKPRRESLKEKVKYEWHLREQSMCPFEGLGAIWGHSQDKSPEVSVCQASLWTLRKGSVAEIQQVRESKTEARGAGRRRGCKSLLTDGNHPGLSSEWKNEASKGLKFLVTKILNWDKIDT